MAGFSADWLKQQQRADAGDAEEPASLLGSARSFMGRVSATAGSFGSGLTGGSGGGVGDGEDGDLEGGGGGGGGGSGWLASGISSVRSAAGLAPSEPPPPSWFPACDGLSRGDRFKVFVIGILLSSAILGFAFVVCLPMVLMFPAKFALAFTLGSVVFLASFAILEGLTSFIRRMFTRERLLFSASYFVSMVLTVYSALVWRWYILVVGFASMQMVALALFAASFVPGGQVSVLLCTITFYANLAHSLTCSPSHLCIRERQVGLSYAFAAFTRTAKVIVGPCLSKITG
jgi:hypothetical protein